MAARALAKVDAGRGYVCTGDCREANLRGWMQAQACYNERGCRRTTLLASSILKIDPLLRCLSARFFHLVVARASRCKTTSRLIGPAHPSVIRGSMAARSHNYAATMHISLPVTAKQGLRRFGEKLVSYWPLARAAPSLFCASRPRRKITSVWIAS